MASVLDEKSSLAAWIPVLLLGVIAGWLALHEMAMQNPRTALDAPTSPPPASVERNRHSLEVRRGALKAGPGGPARSIR